MRNVGLKFRRECCSPLVGDKPLSRKNGDNAEFVLSSKWVLLFGVMERSCGKAYTLYASPWVVIRGVVYLSNSGLSDGFVAAGKRG